ncbi:DUF2500 domain-containing protein [Fervidibacillus albus]|uniref:DUF2500 domain-containing protein n=1 Tax=Fervidibacillus albus TaxID=2980026 RepID=A0A9E8LTJ2_9BACI|nr:DUF2500 domain-containing protein [Fervidibacillus albus]WAA09349.1 DUF2500 domain-containing protein [Fervidibacillus albus]
MADPMFFDDHSMFSFMNIFTIFFFIISSIIILTIIISAIKGIKQWRKNEQSPELSVPAIVKSKRTEVHTYRHHDDHHSSTSANTTYFVTFEFESGDRMELKLLGKDYGMLAEGDVGILTFKGTRYLGFERKKEN